MWEFSFFGNFLKLINRKVKIYYNLSEKHSKQLKKERMLKHMTREELEKAMSEHTPVLIDGNKCYWNNKARQLLIYAEDDWKGILKEEEFGENIPKDITKFPTFVYRTLCAPFEAIAVGKDEDGKFIFSRKAYLNEQKDKLELNKIYQASVINVVSWGVFCKVDEATVLVPAKEFSRCFYSDMRNVAKVGMNFPIMIIAKKQTDDGNIFVTGSRKLGIMKRDYNQWDIVSVTIGNKVSCGDGYYCEVDPTTSGIVDAPGKQYEEGRHVIAYIKKKNDRGYKLRVIDDKQLVT